MNPSSSSTRRRRHAQFGAEALESRSLMTGGAGNTFAIIPGEITKPGGTVSIPITIDPSNFTLPNHRLALGVDVAAASGSQVKAIVLSVTDPNGKVDSQAFHSIYDPHLPRQQTSLGKGTTAMIVPISHIPSDSSKPVTYTINVQAQFKTTGKFLLGLYLPGDANGDGKVNQADLQITKAAMNSRAGSSKYSFDADVNRDGRIGPIDLSYVRQNMGVSTNVSPVVTANLDPASDSGLADRITNIRTVHFSGAATPGATITYTEINQKTPAVTTTADTAGNYNIFIPLADGSNTFKVSSKDGFNQTISGQISPVSYSPLAPKA